MAAGAYDLVIEQGATFRLSLVLTEGDPPAAYDLTGFTPRMQVRAAASDLEVLLECTVDNGRLTVVNAAGGELQLEISAEDTARLDWSAAVYDLILVSSGETVRLMEGAVTVSPAVTR